MPIGHSPPSESTRSKTLVKSSVLADAQNKHSASKLSQLNLPRANTEISETVLSWKEQCKTPTLQPSEVPTSTWIASAVTTTTTYSTSASTSTLLLHRATTTVTSTMPTLPLNRASPLQSTTTTALSMPNSLSEINSRSTLSTSGAASTTMSHNRASSSLQYPPTFAVLSPNTPKESNSLSASEAQSSPCMLTTHTEAATTLTEKTTTPINKRMRSSPQNTAEKVSSIKKLKTKSGQKGTGQKGTGRYWLSESPSTNRFAILDSDQNENSKTESTTDHTKISTVAKKQKPPPIFVQNVERIGVLQNALNTLSTSKYELKIQHNNEVKIQTNDSCHYNEILKLLNSKFTEYYTYKPKELVGFKVVLRGLHYSTDVEDIKIELAERGHDVAHIHNILNSRTKSPLPLFSIELLNKPNNKDIFSLSDLLHCKIQFEKPHKKRSPAQCTNCQKYGHTKNFCTKKPVCVKCAGEHNSSECMPQLSREKLKCALCAENHTANYKGCTVFKSIIEKAKPRQPENAKPLQSDCKIQPQNEISDRVHNEVSYAEALSKNLSVPFAKNNVETAPQSSEMADLKEMMKLLLSQISNMMNMITMLLSKFDVQQPSK